MLHPKIKKMIVGVLRTVGVYVEDSTISVLPKLRIVREQRAQKLLLNLRKMSVWWAGFFVSLSLYYYYA
jgi:hypothetical protein